MKNLLLLYSSVFFISCNTVHYYIVRHAEKASGNMMTNDMPLSQAGVNRAKVLSRVLENKKLRHIFSTDFQRTKNTAAPVAAYYGLPVELYAAKDTFDRTIEKFRKIKKGNVLIVGHSNTVDDLVNSISGQKLVLTDLPDTAYGDLFIVTRKNNHYRFSRSHFGQ